MINIAAFFSFATTYLEKYVGFWAAYLLPTCVLCIAFLHLIVWNKHLGTLTIIRKQTLALTFQVKRPPQGSVLLQAAQIISLAIRSRHRFKAANPSYQQMHYSQMPPWTAESLTEVQRSLKTCRVILCFAIYYLCYFQILSNIISQAGQMETHGIPTDTFSCLNPIFCVIFIPTFQKILYPFLNQRHIHFGPITRMSVGFLFVAFAMAYTAITQHIIYTHGPCYSHPLTCPAGKISNNQHRPNDINVWIQLPSHILLSIGEIFGLGSLGEHAYAEAPADIKVVLQSFCQLTGALGASLAIALSPLCEDPWLVVVYATYAGFAGVVGLVFWAVFRRCDIRETAREGDRQEYDEMRVWWEMGHNVAIDDQLTEVERT
ncbi:uncharacterized protein KY384_005122 [Bacidia gigantensis]|uniref:uncharacterized protein n=1 Tax=Bacidia gigantensis TaxID=2732470 RepID=UPI001D04BE69|nr:uncharacterized protein KY384_005122 [Bacidia gigantensis]KAG8529641.1 hypothetical protein KY384_005122 [Bacidia gigantensis]